MLATPELLQEATQPEILAEVISRCREQIPLYASGANTVASSAISVELRRWPLITKEDIRHDFPHNFLGEEACLEDLLEREIIELEHTSGTSEERVPLLLPQGWWSEQESRALKLNGFVADVLEKNPEARRVTINSPVCSGDIRYLGVPSCAERTVGNNLFVSLSRYPFLWSERDFERIAIEILGWHPQFLDVDPVYGVVFALYCERKKIRLPSLRFIICSYEFVSVTHRSILERVFGVPIFDLYGSTETGHLLMEDGTGQMRPSLETAFLEVLDLESSGIGSLIVTTLTNPFMPLLRYRIGDLVEWAETPYGNRYVLHGRSADAFHISNGKRITTRQIDQCFVGMKGIAHYQLIQHKNGTWLLRFVADNAGPKEGYLEELAKKLTNLLQANDLVKLKQTDMLVPERSGKFRLGYPQKSSLSV